MSEGFTHHVFLSSSFTTGERIAYDVCEKTSAVASPSSARSVLEKIRKECGDDINVAIHYFHSSESGSKAVKDYDGYFEDVKFIDDLEDFVDLIKKSRVLIGLDVAKYIISIIQCTQLKLQKLVYLCYADYLCQFEKRLFDDEIYAFDLGPVVKSVYNKYRGKRDLNDEIPQDPEIHEAIRSRILFATDGIKKLHSIMETLDKYGSLTAASLVDLTHRPNTPWSEIHEEGSSYQRITDSDILKYHCHEMC